MGHYSVRTQTESDAILTLATEAMEAKMNAGEPFTALDISNTLKAKNLPVRHREVSAVVRGFVRRGRHDGVRVCARPDLRFDAGRLRAGVSLPPRHTDPGGLCPRRAGRPATSPNRPRPRPGRRRSGRRTVIAARGNSIARDGR
jgi:hypothetical protein